MILTDIPLKSTIASIKERLATETGLAVGKQKLLTANGTAMRNAVTLGFYNIMPGSVLSLEKKK